MGCQRQQLIHTSKNSVELFRAWLNLPTEVTRSCVSLVDILGTKRTQNEINIEDLICHNHFHPAEHVFSSFWVIQAFSLVPIHLL